MSAGFSLVDSDDYYVEEVYDSVFNNVCVGVPFWIVGIVKVVYAGESYYVKDIYNTVCVLGFILFAFWLLISALIQARRE